MTNVIGHAVSADSIRPKEDHVSDFFSWNLFRFVRNPNNRYFSRIYRAKRSKEDSPRLWVGFMCDTGSFNGIGMNELLRTHGRKKFQVWSHGFEDGWEDITDHFWLLYLKHGACMLDDAYHQWAESEQCRTCSLCGTREADLATLGHPQAPYPDLNGRRA